MAPRMRALRISQHAPWRSGWGIVRQMFFFELYAELLSSSTPSSQQLPPANELAWSIGEPGHDVRDNIGYGITYGSLAQGWRHFVSDFHLVLGTKRKEKEAECRRLRQNLDGLVGY
jgi:hypothetical protein